LNNIDKIELFLEDNVNTTMILPKVNGEVTIFYELLIEKISRNKNFLIKKIENYKNLNELIEPSLFNERKTYLLDIGGTKNIIEDLSKMRDRSQKFFIFLNYALYKKNNHQSVQLNAYDYKKDLSYYLMQDNNFQSLDNKLKAEFINLSCDSPHLFFSELEKFKIQTFILSNVKKNEGNTMLLIRKEIFKYKNEFSIKMLPKLYSLLKKEVDIKKFNF
jgi:hypothetical protein